MIKKSQTKQRKQTIALGLLGTSLGMSLGAGLNVAHAQSGPGMSVDVLVRAAKASDGKTPITEIAVKGIGDVTAIDCDGQAPVFAQHLEKDHPQMALPGNPNILAIERLDRPETCKLSVSYTSGTRTLFKDNAVVVELPSANDPDSSGSGSAPSQAATTSSDNNMSSGSSNGGGGYTLTTYSREAFVNASVRGRSSWDDGGAHSYASFGGLRTDLSLNDFIVKVDGTEVSQDRIRGFGHDAMDTTVGILIDTSESMEKEDGKLTKARDAAYTLLRTLQPSLDNLFMIHFNQEIAVNDEPFSASGRPANASIENSTFAAPGDTRAPFWVYRVAPVPGKTFVPHNPDTYMALSYPDDGWDSTHLFDAIIKATDLMAQGTDADQKKISELARTNPQSVASYPRLVHRRKVLFVITDGVDKTGKISAAIRKAEANSVEVDAIGIFGRTDKPQEVAEGKALLDELTRKTGGIAIYPASPEDLVNQAQNFVAEMHLKYHFSVKLDANQGSGCHSLQVAAVDPTAIRNGYYSQLVGDSKESFIENQIPGYKWARQEFEDSKNMTADAFFRRYAADCYSEAARCVADPQSCKPRPVEPMSGVVTGVFGSNDNLPGPYSNSAPVERRAPAPAPAPEVYSDSELAATNSCRCEAPMQTRIREFGIGNLMNYCSYRPQKGGELLCGCPESIAACVDRYNRDAANQALRSGYTPRVERGGPVPQVREVHLGNPAYGSSGGQDTYGRSSSSAAASPLSDDLAIKTLQKSCSYEKDLIDIKRDGHTVEEMLTHKFYDKHYKDDNSFDFDSKDPKDSKKKKKDSDWDYTSVTPDYRRTLHEWTVKSANEVRDQGRFEQRARYLSQYQLDVSARTMFGDSCQ